MNARVRRILRNCKRRIQKRLRVRQWREQRRAMLRARNIHYEVAEKTRGLHCGGIGAIHLMVQRIGLPKLLDQNLGVLKRHLPYFESDHVLNMAYNILAGGEVLEDIEVLRNNENYLNALGAQRIPDPTTEGDFLRRCEVEDIETVMRVINRKRVEIWGQQPKEFFEHGILEADGTIAATTGECKQGMDMSFKGVWGYHPLLVSLANTQEPLFLVNRSGNRPSYEGAVQRIDQAIELCREAGFRKISIRGDTDFALTENLDRWDGASIGFVFGLDAMPNLVEIAEKLDSGCWKQLDRPAKYEVATQPRQRPPRVKEAIVRARGYENIRLLGEEVAEFSYRPGKCKQAYRVVVLRKNLSVEQGERCLFDDIRYFFYITNETGWSEAEVVYFANDRCNQENLIDQLKNAIGAMRMPAHDLVANWAYMVIASLAWTLKAWFGLLHPEREPRAAILSMEFKKFLRMFMLLPCQLIRAGRRIVYRLLSWNPWVGALLRGVDAMRGLALT